MNTNYDELGFKKVKVKHGQLSRSEVDRQFFKSSEKWYDKGKKYEVTQMQQMWQHIY